MVKVYRFSFDTKWGQGDNNLFLFCCRWVKRLWRRKRQCLERFLVLWEWMYFLSYKHSLQCCHSYEEKSFPLPSVLAFAYTKSTLNLKGSREIHSVVIVWHGPCCVFSPSLAYSKLSFFRQYNQTCSVFDNNAHLSLMPNTHFPLDCLSVRCRISFLPK